MNVASVIESILFVHGEPLAEKKLAEIAQVSVPEAAQGLRELERRLAGRGLALVEKAGEWQMVTHPDNAAHIETLQKDQHTHDLSRAALETLAIIAYKGPLTRAEIEYIRGVHSSFSLRTLLMRGLVERVENEKDARSFLYAASFDFLKYLGLARLKDLPDYESLRGSLEAEHSPDGSPYENQ